MGYEKFLVGMTPIDVTLEVGGEQIPIKVRPITWSRRLQIRSFAVKWDAQQNTLFDSDYYIRECLKAMIVEAPWGQTTDVFLSQIAEPLGTALEALVPRAFATGEADLGQAKKE